MTRFGLDSASVVANLAVSRVFLWIYTSVTSPGRDWHEVVVKRCHLYPAGRWHEADIDHGGACRRVGHVTHPANKLESRGLVSFFFKHLHIFPLFSEKSTLSSQVTPTCRELSQSDGATGSWGKINRAAAAVAASPAVASFPSSLLSVTPWLWAEMWTDFRSWRKESMFYLLAGKLRAHRGHVRWSEGHVKRILLPRSGAVAGTPFDIDRELLRKGPAGEEQITIVLLDAQMSPVWQFPSST